MSTIARRPRQVKPASGRCGWLLQPGDGRNAHPGILSINGTAYSFAFIQDGPAVLGFRLEKKDQTSYDVDTSTQHWRCECPDFAFCRDGRDPKGCKHIAAVKAALAFLGFPLPAPIPLGRGDALPDATGTHGDPYAYSNSNDDPR